LTKIINKTTDGFASNLEISNLKSKVELSPEFYGTVFFLEKNFKAKIESFIDIDLNCIQFSSYSKNCIFCSSKLSGDKSRFSKAICYYFADGPKSVQLNILWDSQVLTIFFMTANRSLLMKTETKMNVRVLTKYVFVTPGFISNTYQ